MNQSRFKERTPLNNNKNQEQENKKEKPDKLCFYLFLRVVSERAQDNAHPVGAEEKYKKDDEVKNKGHGGYLL